jgi:50S ribosomal subunit-associated GTPase HflX
LHQIGADQNKLYIFNKTDQLWPEQIQALQQEFSDLHPLFVSGLKKQGLDVLQEEIVKKLYNGVEK